MKASRLILLALFLVCTNSIVRSQTSVPRTVLMEEGTNWACGPCASANPYIEQFVHEHTGSVIHLAYHPNWPGATDPMYLNDKNDNQYRVATYYGISGVPSVVFDGKDVFNPGGIGQLEAYWTSHISNSSPIALTVQRAEVGDSVLVTVTVHVVGSVASYSNLHLRIAAAEKEVDVKGPNGEPKYVNAMRTMIGGYQGMPLTVKQGDLLTMHYTYPLLAAYNRSRMFEVAFVQTDASSHEVLQAASTEQSQTFAPIAGEQLFGRVQGESKLTFDLTNRSAAQGTYAVKYYPTSLQPWTITLDGTPASAGLNVILAGGNTHSIVVAATPGASGYTSGVLVAVGPNGDTSTLPFKMIAPDVHTAFVDIFGDSTTEVQTELSLIKLNERYAELSSIEAHSMAAWDTTQYHEVIVGAGKWIVDGTDKTDIQSYLLQGGHLLLHGGEIAFGLADANASATNDVAFLSNILHAKYVKDSAGPRMLYGVSGDPISSNILGPTNLYKQTFEVNQPDEITAQNGAIPVFYYGSAQTQVAGVRYVDPVNNQKLVYLAFGLENLSNIDEATIVKNSLTWFRQPFVAAVNANQPTTTVLEQNYPNPFNPSTEIRYTLERAEEVQLSIYDVTGKLVRELVHASEASGQHTVVFDAASLPSGVYFYELHAGAFFARRAMTLTK